MNSPASTTTESVEGLRSLLPLAPPTSLIEAMNNPTAEALETLNDAISVVKAELQKIQLDYEQRERDADNQGFHDEARVYRQQAAAVETARWKADNALTALFIDTCERITTHASQVRQEAAAVALVKSIELPNIVHTAAVEVVE